MLTSASCSITNVILPYCTKIDPLMNRNLIASVCYKSPFSLTMARWQRREINAQCPQLSEVETDQGFSCSVRTTVLIKESFKILSHYINLAANKIKRKILKQKVEISNWQQDYIDAKSSPEYESAIEVCKQLGIISKNSTAHNLPINKVGFILMIGMFLSNLNKFKSK